MAQLADLVVTVSVDRKQAEAALTKLQQQLGVTAQKAGASGRSLDQNFSDLVKRSVSGLTKDFGSLGSGIGGAMSKTGALSAGLGVVAGAASVTAAAIGAVTAASTKAVQAFIAQEDAELRVKAALEIQGAAMADNVAALKAQAAALQTTSRHGDEAIENAQALAMAMGVAASKVPQLTEVAVDLSAVLKQDLDTTTRDLARTLSGTLPRSLSVAMPALKSLTEEQLRAGDAIRLAGERFRGFAEKDAAGVGGSLTQLKNAWGDAWEEMGRGISENAQLAESMRGLAQFISQDVVPAALSLGQTIGTLARPLADFIKDLKFIAASKEQGSGSAFAGTAIGNAAAAREQVAGARDRVRELNAELEKQKKALAELNPMWEVDRPALERSAQEQIAATTAELQRAEKNVVALTKSYQDLRAVAAGMSPTERGGAAAAAGGVTGGVSNLGDGDGGGKSDKQKLRDLVREQVSASQKLKELAGELYQKDADRLKALESYASTSNGLSEQVRAALLAGKITRADADAMLAPLGESAADLMKDVKALAAQAGASMGPKAAWDAETMGAPSADQAGAQAVADAEFAAAVRMAEVTKTKRDAMAELIITTGDLKIATMEQALADSEAALKADILAMSIDGLDVKEQALLATRLASIEQQKAAIADAVAATPEAEAEALANLVLELGNVDLARQQAAITKAEATLQHDIEAMALDGLTAAEEREIGARQRGIGKLKERLALDKQAAKQAQLTKNARFQEYTTEMSGALSSVAAVTKSTKAKIAIQAGKNVLDGLTQTAAAAAKIASGDYAAGAAHAVSAVAYFYAASQAGKGGGGGGGVPSGGGGGSDDRAPRENPGMDTYREMRESEPARRGPAYQIAITGTLLGGQPQDIARQIQSYLHQFASESSGRSEAVRG